MTRNRQNCKGTKTTGKHKLPIPTNQVKKKDGKLFVITKGIKVYPQKRKHYILKCSKCGSGAFIATPDRCSKCEALVVFIAT